MENYVKLGKNSILGKIFKVIVPKRLLHNGSGYRKKVEQVVKTERELVRTRLKCQDVPEKNRSSSLLLKSWLLPRMVDTSLGV